MECDDTNMEAFYASLETKTTSPSHISVRASPSREKTQKAIQVLRDLVSKKFSFLMHPGRSIAMKDTLRYLLSLPPEEGLFSTRTKSLLLQLSQSFPQWSLDYENADLKLGSANAGLSKAVKVMNDLKANVREFQEMDKEEKCLCNQLDCLQGQKRDLEEKINAIKAEIAKSRVKRDAVAKRKRELFQEGKVVKEKRDDLWNQVPRLKAEQEWARIARPTIEAEWSKLGEQLKECTDFKEWAAVSSASVLHRRS